MKNIKILIACILLISFVGCKSPRRKSSKPKRSYTTHTVHQTNDGRCFYHDDNNFLYWYVIYGDNGTRYPSSPSIKGGVWEKNQSTKEEIKELEEQVKEAEPEAVNVDNEGDTITDAEAAEISMENAEPDIQSEPGGYDPSDNNSMDSDSGSSDSSDSGSSDSGGSDSGGGDSGGCK